MTRTAIAGIAPAFLFVFALLALASADAPRSQASGSLGVIAPTPTPSPIVCPLFTPAPTPTPLTSPPPPPSITETFCAPSRQQATQLHVRVHTGGAPLSAGVQENAAGCPDPTITISDDAGFKVALVDWNNTHCVSPGEFVVMQFSSSVTPTIVCWHWISFGAPFPGPESCLSRTGMDRMNIDMEEEATPANSSSSLGSVEGCRRIDENDLLDADEDVADGLLIDITADGVASFNNGGTPADTTDDIGGIIAYTYELGYLASALTVQEQTIDSQTVNMLARNGGSAIFNASDGVPDDNADNVWNSAALDTSATEPESDNGVLDRLTIVSETGAAAGNYNLRQSNNAHFDVTGTAYEPEITNNAVVAVNEACFASPPINPPTPTPPATPTPTPTPAPTPGIVCPAPPTPSGAPTPSPPPTPGPTDFDVIATYTFTNTGGQTANDLHVCTNIDMGGVAVQINAPGCPTPTVNHVLRSRYIDVIWSTACVNPFERVTINMGVSTSFTALCIWTLDGRPLQGCEATAGTPATSSPTLTPTPAPQCPPDPSPLPTMATASQTFTNNTGQAVSDLHARWNGPITVCLLENAPGCPPPSGSGFPNIDYDWGTACVDPGESVSIVYRNEPPATLLCAEWTLLGTPIGQAVFGRPMCIFANTPTPSPTPGSGTPTPTPTPPPNLPMDVMSIDMDEEATPANTDSALGTRESCARINENDALDADEDVLDGLNVDVTAAGVPAYNDGGTPSDLTDDTGGIIGYAHNLTYPANLRVESVIINNPGVNLLIRNPGSSPFDGSDPLPDSDGEFISAVLDVGSGTPESGDGVLDRMTLTSSGLPGAGNFALTLLNNVHLDASGAAYDPLATNNGVVAVNEACGASPVITPPPTPTPEPTPTPGPPTPTPSPTPVICPAPTPSPTPSPPPGTPGPSTNFMGFCNRNQQAASDLHIRISNVGTSAQLNQNAPGCPEPTITTTTGSPTVDVVWPVACVDQGESVTLAVTCQAPCFIIFIQCYDWTRFGTVLPSSPTPCATTTPPPPTSSATPWPELPMQAMSIDMNEEATPANTSTSLGSLEACARINENNILDADEDSTDGIDIDVTALGIPPYNDGGNSDPSDDSGGIIGYAYDFGYNEVNLTVDAQVYNDAAVNVMSASAGSLIFNASDPVPDTTAGNTWVSAAIDNGAAVPESGSGVLDRLTLVSDAGAVTGIYPLTLSNNVHLDASGAAFTPLGTIDARVVINATCAISQVPGSGTPPLPSGTATPPPTASPSPSPSPWATPGTPSPSPTATPPIDITVWTFVNETGQAASDLHASYNGPIIPRRIVENAPGCPEPSIVWSTGQSRFALDWGVACVDAQETVMVEIGSEPPAQRTCYHWTISGTPIEPSCLTPTPTPTPSPTPTPTPTPPACIPDDNDFDNDGQNNNRDRDDDNDGVRDSNDRDDDNDGVRDSRDPDDDNDGIPDRADRDDGKLYCGQRPHQVSGPTVP